MGEPVRAALNDGLIYDAAEGRNDPYQLHATDLEFAALITQAEAEPDLIKRMDLIDQMAERIRAQIIVRA